MAEAYIVDALRSPTGKRKGSLAAVHGADLGAHVIKAIVERNGVPAGDYDDVIFGCVDTIGALAGDSVQMMTIHKSKGLEFETVILPGLHRTTGGNDSSLLLWDEVAGADGHEHLLVAPMKAKGAGREQSTTADH